MGIDVFVDANLKAWVLEINDSPSLNINICKEGGRGEGLITLPSEVDRYIKTKVVGSALNMMLETKGKSQKSRRAKRSEIQEYECWHRLDTGLLLP